MIPEEVAILDQEIWQEYIFQQRNMFFNRALIDTLDTKVLCLKFMKNLCALLKVANTNGSVNIQRYCDTSQETYMGNSMSSQPVISPLSTDLFESWCVVS